MYTDLVIVYDLWYTSKLTLLGSDIDTLAAAPRNVKSADFFELYPEILRRKAQPNAISSLVPVPEAFVPIIKMVLNGIEIDLIFVSIESLSTLPKDLKLTDNNLLKGLDQSSIRAITGPRVTDEILSLVPEQKTFRTALRAIKIWAKERAVYANIVGYPGGVAWAMLVARVCQLYPHAVGATIVAKFFLVMKDWGWPTPVMLKEIESGAGNEKVWNPKLYKGDLSNLMPVITPAYPSMCSTYNISKSGKAVILRELTRGNTITQSIFFGNGKWSELFAKHSFFTKDHKYYLSVIASSGNEEIAKAWSGMVESKVRILVSQLELVSDQISLARPFTKGFKRQHKCASEKEMNEVKKGSMKYQVKDAEAIENNDQDLLRGVPLVNESKDTSTEGKDFWTHTFYIGIDLTAQAKKNLNLVASINFFKGTCQQWNQYDQAKNGLDVVPCKAYELPDDLFNSKDGDVKPEKPVKKVLAKRNASMEPVVNGDSKRLKMEAAPTPTPQPV